MMTFNVHDKELNLNQSLVLEASAGTGKTYSIENLFVRLLTESESLVENILVMTFTKAAAKELKERIKARLHKAIQEIEDSDSLRKLKNALIDFDLATITTIHAFCFQALKEEGLESGASLKVDRLSLGPSKAFLLETVENLFRTQLSEPNYTSSQLAILLKRHQFQVSELIADILKVLERGVSIESVQTNGELLKELELGLKKYPEIDAIAEEHGHCFYGLAQGRTKTLKKEYAHVFNHEILSLKNISKASELLSQLTLSNLKQKATLPQNVLNVVQGITEEVKPTVDKLGTYRFLFQRLSSECEKVVLQKFEENDLADFSHLLKKMESLVATDLHFRERLAKRFSTVIIDEFQDTDPLQWKIFETLFNNGKNHLILVGDPKQSIYAFRSADVYTYLHAVKHLKNASSYLLSTNYRSSPALVEAVNGFFQFPESIPLPELKSSLNFNPVLAQEKKNFKLSEQELPLKFLVSEVNKETSLEEVEEYVFFPYFLQEMKLLKEQGISFSEMAILVRDRNQADRISSFLKKYRIPFVLQKNKLFNQSIAFSSLLHLLKAILYPRNFSALQVALGTPFFQWSWQELKQLQDFSVMTEVLTHFYDWHRQWEEKGIAATFQSFLKSHFLSSESLRDKLVAYPAGLKILHEAWQMIEWLALQERENHFTPYALYQELKGLQEEENGDDEEIKLVPFTEEEGVQILTLHMSKGLEFDVVFSLGTMNRTPASSELIPVKREGMIRLQTVDPESEIYSQFLKESDAEKARQLYVALTRAKERVYLPFIEGLKRPKEGTASPLELHLAKLAKKSSLYDAFEHPLVPLIEEEVAHRRLQGVEIKRLEKSVPFDFEKESTEKVEWVPPNPYTLSFESRASFSFTSLAKIEFHPQDKKNVPTLFNETVMTAHTLPAGSLTGEILHEILEEIPFHDLSNLIPLVEKKLSNTPYEPWKEVFVEIIHRALTLPLGEKSFALKNLKASSLYKEMEFLYPLDLAITLEGEMKGVIDLLFEVDNKYYLLDWKSNWLGIGQEFYELPFLQKEMELHQYTMQAHLYKIAIREYLRQIDPRPFEECFGGMCYLFLRGFDGKRGLLWIQ